MYIDLSHIIHGVYLDSSHNEAYIKCILLKSYVSLDLFCNSFDRQIIVGDSRCVVQALGEDHENRTKCGTMSVNDAQSIDRRTVLVNRRLVQRRFKLFSRFKVWVDGGASTNRRWCDK